MQFNALAVFTLCACVAQTLAAPAPGSQEGHPLPRERRSEDSKDSADWWFRPRPVIVPVPPVVEPYHIEPSYSSPGKLLNYKKPGFDGNQVNKWAHGGVNTISGNYISGTNTISNGGVEHSNDD